VISPPANGKQISRIFAVGLLSGVTKKLDAFMLLGFRHDNGQRSHHSHPGIDLKS